MKRPLHALPIVRSVSTVRRSDRSSDALMSSVTASECDSTKCGWAIAACAPTAVLGPQAVGLGLSGVGAGVCRDCIGEAIQQYVDLSTGPGGVPFITSLPGL